MANIDIKPSKTMANLLHVLPAYADDSKKSVNMIVEVGAHSLNKYELVTETGHLKLDRVGYSPMTYPFTYGAIPATWDLDGDPLDVLLPNVTEPLVPGSLLEARIIGIMKFVDGGEQDDKVIAVVDSDKRFDHIRSYEDLGEYFVKESTYYWEHYKDMKKPGTGKVEGFFGVEEAQRIIDECAERYVAEYTPKFA
jgi:inorganic pyrophosphatase